jgi:hypothetical protein
MKLAACIDSFRAAWNATFDATGDLAVKAGSMAALARRAQCLPLHFPEQRALYRRYRGLRSLCMGMVK